MFVCQSKIKIIYLLITIFGSTSILMSESFKYEFKFIKILEHGKKQEFSPAEIDITEEIHNFTVEESKKKNERYPFYIKEISEKDIGKQIKLNVKNNDNWIIFSPLNGKLTISKNKKVKIKVLMIRKYTEIYFDIFANYEYSIQVFYTESKKKALQIRDDLIRDKFDAYYEVIPIIPNKGYMYKVKIGHFIDIKEAQEIKNKIKKWYPTRFDGSFITGRMKYL